MTLGAVMLCSAVWQTPAQSNVYSLDVVGYYIVPISPGWNVVANQFIPATNYNANSVLLGQAVDGSLLYRFNPATQGYYEAGTYFTGVGWYAPSGNPNDPALNLPLGDGVLIWTPQRWTNIFVGFVAQGYLTNPLPAGFSLKSSIVPVAGGLETIIAFPAHPNDKVWRGAPPVPSFYTFDELDLVWHPEEPSLNVGEGFFLYTTDPRLWVWNFIVQSVPSPLTSSRTALAAPAIVVAPPLLFNLTLKNGAAMLSINKSPGQYYNVQFSQDRASWTTVATGQNSALWQEPLRPGTRGYYRLALLP
jgi:hypothetical protein